MTIAMLAAPAAAIAGPAWRVVGGTAQHGPALIIAYGCAGCHTVPGVKGARGNVGPPLTRFGDRTYIAGMLRNTPANLVRWIRDPQGVLPGNAMPNMGVTEAEARDIAAYLYTLR
jgi:cytochrome c